MLSNINILITDVYSTIICMSNGTKQQNKIFNDFIGETYQI